MLRTLEIRLRAASGYTEARRDKQKRITKRTLELIESYAVSTPADMALCALAAAHLDDATNLPVARSCPGVAPLSVPDKDKEANPCRRAVQLARLGYASRSLYRTPK